jgi:FtsP/CotA-like multicopper oxidase with cupredoxin domain
MSNFTRMLFNAVQLLLWTSLISLVRSLNTPQSCTKTCTLNLEVVQFKGTSSSFETRGYNGGIPGPTIRTSAGSTLTIKLVNTLNNDANNFIGTNLYNWPNSTSLHTHGLHVSSVSDDVLTQVVSLRIHFHLLCFCRDIM